MKRHRKNWRLWASAAVLVLVVAGTGWLAVNASAVAATNRIEWNGKSRFLAGANVPWFNWGCDFGCGASGGVSDPAVRGALDARFQQFRATGMDTLRWWMFEPNGAAGSIWQIRPGSNGQLEVNPTVYADIDAALALADKHNLNFVFVLFAGVGPDNMPAAWVNDPAQRQQLANALGPLFSRYASSNRIIAWELFNEPEYQIWSGAASQANVVALAQLLEQQVHSRSKALVTVGSAMVDGLPMWKNVNLDFYAPHWYSNMGGGDWCAACRDYTSLAKQYGITKPVVIGEWDAPDGGSTSGRWQHWLDAGYAGAFAWSLFPERTYDRIPMGYATAASFMQKNGPLLNGTPTPTPTPTKTATAAPTQSATAVPPTATKTPTVGATATKTATPAPTGSATATASATVKPSSTATATASATATKTATASVTATKTATAGGTATATASATATRTPSPQPTATATATATPPPAAGPECQRLFRFRDPNRLIFRSVWRSVDCTTGELLNVVR